MIKLPNPKTLARLLRSLERGEESSFEFSVMVLPMCMMITLIAVVTLVRGSQLPLWTAAAACARAGVTTLDETIGMRQAYDAGMNSLLANDISALNEPNVDPDAPDGWKRGGRFVCTVSYKINAGTVPGFGDNFPDGIPVSATVELRIEGKKSQWDPSLP